MLKWKQLLACTLCLSLLGQSAVFAAPARQTSKQPQTLAEYQQRAKAEIQKSPWIQREGKYILSAGGAVVAGFIVQEVRHQRRLKALQQGYEANLNATAEIVGRKYDARFRESLAVNEKELASLRKKLSLSQQEAEAAKKELAEVQASKKQIEQELAGFKQKAASEAQRGKLQARRLDAVKKSFITPPQPRRWLQSARKEAAYREAELQRMISLLDERNRITKAHYDFLAGYRLDKWNGKLEIYEKIFNSKVPEEERLALRNQLAQEPWLRQATPAQQKEFMKIIDRAVEMKIHNKYAVSRMFVENQLPIYERLVALCRHVFQVKTLMVTSLIVALGVSAQTASAQKMADRVNKNFDLFLNATPQELAEMQKDPEVVKVCVQGAEVLHQMNLLDREGQKILSQAWRNGGTPKLNRATPAQLAR